jgi:non-homologous end joining protein Ku
LCPLAHYASGCCRNKREVVKGYEYGRGQFVTFTPEELKALDVESSKVIDLEKFVPRGDLRTERRNHL